MKKRGSEAIVAWIAVQLALLAGLFAIYLDLFG